MTRRHVVASALVASSLVVLIGSLRPWIRSGRRLRSSYELFALADRLGVVAGPGGAVLRAWVVLPLAVATIIAAVVLGRLRLAGWVGLPVGLVALIVTSLAIVLLNRSPLRAENGLVTTAVGAFLCTVCSIVALATSGRKPAYAAREAEQR